MTITRSHPSPGKLQNKKQTPFMHRSRLVSWLKGVIRVGRHVSLSSLPGLTIILHSFKSQFAAGEKSLGNEGFYDECIAN
jgi:hypothetical protein